MLKIHVYWIYTPDCVLEKNPKYEKTEEMRSFEEEWFQYILNNIDKPWSWAALSSNTNITSHTVQKHKRLPWHWEKLACPFPLGREMFDIPDFAWEAVKDLPEEEKDWFWISGHPELPLEEVINHPTYPWDWFQVSQHPALTWEIIESHSNLPWDWKGLSMNTMPVWKYEYTQEYEKWLREEEWRNVRLEDVD